MTYASEVTDPDERLLNRFWRVLYALRAQPAKAVTDLPVPTCYKEVRLALDRGFIVSDEGYALTDAGRGALNAELAKRRERAERLGADPKQTSEMKRLATARWKGHTETREERALVLAIDLVLLSLRDSPADTVAEIARRVRCNPSTVKRAVSDDLRSGLVRTEERGYVLTAKGRARLDAELKAHWPSDEVWAAELEERAAFEQVLGIFVSPEDPFGRTLLKKFGRLH